MKLKSYLQIKRMHFVLLLLGCLAVPTALLLSVGADAQTYSLNQAGSDALRLDSRIKAAKSRLFESQEELRLARAINRPVIRGNSQGGYSANENEASFRNYSGTNWRLGINVTQNVWSFGRLDARVDRARNLIASAKSGVDLARNEVLSDVVQVYAGQFRRNLILNEWQKLEYRLEDLEKQTQQRVSAGRARVSDLGTVRVRKFRARADRINANAELRAARIELAQLTGQIRANINPRGLAVMQVPESLEEMYRIAESYSPRISQAKHDYAAAKAEIKLAKAEQMPSLDANFSYNTGSTGDFGSTDTLVALRLNIPIYEGGSLRARARQASHGLEAAKKDLDAVRDMVFRTIKIEWERLQGHRQAVQDFQMAVTATKEITKNVKERLNAGRASVSEHIEAEQLLAESWVQFYRQQLETDVSTVRLLGELALLERAVGVSRKQSKSGPVLSLK